MSLVFHTERLTLKPISASDIDIALELFTDPQVMEFLWPVETEQEVRNSMEKSMRRAADGAIGVWTVADQDSGEKFGTSALLPLPIVEDDTNWDLISESHPIDYEIEIGYILKPDAWGKGIATEAAQGIVKFGFEHIATDEICAVISDRNERSRNVLLKAGFTEIGLRKAYNTLCPGFKISRHQWEQRMFEKDNQ